MNGKPALIIEAKNPNEDINNWKSQCSSYCLELNRLQKENPVKYFMLSNGLNTILTPWDQDLEIFQLNFEDFTEGNEKYEKFKNFLERNKFIRIIKSRSIIGFCSGSCFSSTLTISGFLNESATSFNISN